MSNGDTAANKPTGKGGGGWGCGVAVMVMIGALVKFGGKSGPTVEKAVKGEGALFQRAERGLLQGGESAAQRSASRAGKTATRQESQFLKYVKEEGPGFAKDVAENVAQNQLDDRRRQQKQQNAPPPQRTGGAQSPPYSRPWYESREYKPGDLFTPSDFGDGEDR